MFEFKKLSKYRFIGWAGVNTDDVIMELFPNPFVHHTGYTQTLQFHDEFIVLVEAIPEIKLRKLGDGSVDHFCFILVLGTNREFGGWLRFWDNELREELPEYWFEEIKE